MLPDMKTKQTVILCYFQFPSSLLSSLTFAAIAWFFLHEEVVNYMWERRFLYPIQPRPTARLRHSHSEAWEGSGHWILMIEVAFSIFDKEWRMKKVSHTARGRS